MTPLTALIEILNRIGANNGSSIFINCQELSEWPIDVVKAIKAYGLLTQAPPATRTVCIGCEQSCSMPVNVLTNQTDTPTAFVVCDKRDDINRISIPLNHIEQWQASGYSLANMLSKLLELPISGTNAVNSARWEIGVIRGTKHSSHIILTADNKLILSTAGHQLALNELLSFVNKTIKIDKPKILRAVDNPAIGGGDTESASQREKRLKDRVDRLRLNGTKAFLKKTAEEEGISITRLKQIVYK